MILIASAVMELNAISILFRWIHIVSACALAGTVFVFSVIMPIALRGLDPETRLAINARTHRGRKMTLHITFLLFLISGIYNAWKNWPIYTQNPAVMHALFGMHVLLALAAITILMIAFAGREPKPGRSGWTKWALVLLLLAIAFSSTLKSAREWAMTHAVDARGH
jgi:cytochrome bd-type quinol oxidase subunit 1